MQPCQGDACDFVESSNHDTVWFVQNLHLSKIRPRGIRPRVGRPDLLPRSSAARRKAPDLHRVLRKLARQLPPIASGARPTHH